jgi:hypothetical protein
MTILEVQFRCNSVLVERKPVDPPLYPKQADLRE